ncbi:peptidoglycan-binding protein [Candidatus Kaiserbacteria bacterium]|nr:peptidoglycan-binding protein [Candidatus Kaiserbacteria bacterium]
MQTQRLFVGAGAAMAAAFGVTALATLALFFHNIPVAHASCIGASQAEYQRLFSQGGYAFIGTITDVHLDSTSPTQYGMQTDLYTVKAQVDRSWNSKSGASTSFKSVVTHPAPASATGVQMSISDQTSPFTVGTHEAVFVWNNNGMLSSEEGGCSFNLHLNSSVAETSFIRQMGSWGFGEGDTPGSTSDNWGTAAGTYCPRLSQTLVRGSSGNQVLELQKFLSDYYDIPPTTIQTGYFGRITQGYVIQFQKEQGLPSYGIAGSMTRAAIAKVCGGISPSPEVGIVPDRIKFGSTAEEKSRILGFNGEYGPNISPEYINTMINYRIPSKSEAVQMDIYTLCAANKTEADSIIAKYIDYKNYDPHVLDNPNSTEEQKAERRKQGYGTYFLRNSQKTAKQYNYIYAMNLPSPNNYAQAAMLFDCNYFMPNKNEIPGANLYGNNYAGSIGTFTHPVKTLESFLDFVKYYNQSGDWYRVRASEDQNSITITFNKALQNLSDWGIPVTYSYHSIGYFLDKRTGVVTSSQKILPGTSTGKIDENLLR